MAPATFYVQDCPTCGRKVQVRVEYLGKRVVCQHCRGPFIARDPAFRPDTGGHPDSLLDRADHLLVRAERVRARPR